MTPFQRDTLIAAHKHSSRHRDEVFKSTIFGCFYCMSNFKPDEIEDWELESSLALCPKCGIDAVIGSASGYPVTDEDFLEAMNSFWF
jgi:hypothetical protein